jgi:hypothetical protein
MLLGCNELIFNPLIRWWRLGPINKQLRIFVWSDAPVHYKVSMMSCELLGPIDQGFSLTRTQTCSRTMASQQLLSFPS